MNKVIVRHDPDTGDTFTVPAKWEICDECEGHGKHSRHLGAFTGSEFAEEFPDEESRRDYFSGAFDKRCGACKGTGKVLVVDRDGCDADDLAAIDKADDEERGYLAMQASERRFGA